MLVPNCAAAEPDGGRPERPLTVMTYNIHHGAGIDGVLDLERIAVLIEKSGADVVGLQEVDRHWSERSNWVDQPAWFAKRLKMHYAYAANLDLPPVNPGEPRRQYGTAILSKYPIKDFTNTLLPLYPTGEQRGLAVATIKVRGADLRFANTHLTSNNNAERLEQAQKVVELLGTSKVADAARRRPERAAGRAGDQDADRAYWTTPGPRSASARATRSRRTTRPPGSTTSCTARTGADEGVGAR